MIAASARAKLSAADIALAEAQSTAAAAQIASVTIAQISEDALGELA
jgi:hypothetical protein